MLPQVNIVLLETDLNILISVSVALWKITPH